MELKKRHEILEEDTWDLKILFKTPEEYDKALQHFANKSLKSWESISKNSAISSAKDLQKTLEFYFSLQRELSKLYAYAHHDFDTEITNNAAKGRLQQIMMVYQEFEKNSAWLEPALAAIPDTTFKNFINDPSLATYQFFLEKLYKLKQHLLSEDQEKLLAEASIALDTPEKAFGALNNADIKFTEAEDSNKNRNPLSHGSYGVYLRSKDRVLRKNAFQNMHQAFLSHENSLCELLLGHIYTHKFQSSIRHYSSCLEAALKPKNIDVVVYRNLIQEVRKHLPSLHEYLSLRKTILQVDELHLYDCYVPLFDLPQNKIPYPQAMEWVIESVHPLGCEYQRQLQKGLLENRWVDKFENQHKRSGAYSGGCYDSHPYILLNYNETLNDVFTLAHEAGHSMHSLYSRSHQDFHNSHYPIFVAEVASTFNEELLLHLLLKKFSSKEEQLYLINQKLEDIRTTLFRQTMFAEFELYIHECVEKQLPLTPESLKTYYMQLNQDYFGKDVYVDPEIAIEWARIPHFYSNFYVYQYATGISAALTLAKKVLEGSDKDRDQYLSFLKLGGSQYPIDMLQVAGVDMRQASPIASALSQFDILVKKLETLYKS